MNEYEPLSPTDEPGSSQKESKPKLSLETILNFLHEEGFSGGTFSDVDVPGLGDESYNPSKRMMEAPDAICLAQVTENSLHEIGVRIGDLLFIDKHAEPKNGDIIVAHVNEPVVRRYYEENGYVELRSENPHIEPIRESERGNLEIWGVVKKVFRTYDEVL